MVKWITCICNLHSPTYKVYLILSHLLWNSIETTIKSFKFDDENEYEIKRKVFARVLTKKVSTVIYTEGR